MLLALGQFTFETDSASFEELSRQVEWRHESSDRVGSRPAYQFTGPGVEAVSISGAVYPGQIGRTSALNELEALGEGGEPQPLVDARGRHHGSFVILALDRSETLFGRDGAPRRVGFTLDLERVG